MMLSQLLDSVTIMALVGNGAYGPIYSGAEVTLPCYFEAGFKRISNDMGEELVASAMFLCSGQANVFVGSKVQRSGTIYRVIQVEQVMMGKRVDHLAVYLQSVGSGV